MLDRSGAKLEDSEMEVLTLFYDGSGAKYGDGSGTRVWYVSGDGYGDGYGDGSGDGSGSGYGYGDGYGSGSGSGYGYGDGYGSGDGYGDGNQ